MPRFQLSVKDGYTHITPRMCVYNYFNSICRNTLANNYIYIYMYTKLTNQNRIVKHKINKAIYSINYIFTIQTRTDAMF